MAKKSNGFGGGSIFDIVKSVDSSAEIIGQSQLAVIKEYIDTGSYILNAALTGSLFKGVPSGRVLTLSGVSGAGKSYLALSICRNAQKMGYTPIYMDSEGAIDIDTVRRIGCDTNNFILKQVNTLSEVANFMINIINKLKEVPEENRQKVIFVLDSLSNCTSDKELRDITEGTGKQDMTKQKEIKALYRVVLTPMNQLQIPFVVNTHTYKTQDLFAKDVVSGGTGVAYGGSLTLMLSPAKLDDKESDKIAEGKTGEYVKTGVVVTAKTDKSRFTIPQRVKFTIPYFKAPNPYVGLNQYITWENSGILQGKLISEKEYSKLTDAEKAKCHEMTAEDGSVAYAYPKDTARTIVVKHLGVEIDMKELFTPKVFTEELLRKLDEEVIRPNFELPDQDSSRDIEEMFGEGEESGSES